MTDWLNKTHVGDCRELLARMVADGARVQTCVTSPPYFGLRDYGTATWVGGNPQCDHLQKVGGTGRSTLGAASGGHAISNEERTRSTTRSFVPFASVCGKCGAHRVDRQIGLEPTPAEYVEQIVGVFRLVRQLLATDGTLWLNLGDCYANDGKWGGSTSGKHACALHGDTGVGRGRKFTGTKPKDLLGIPWRVAFALQEDGWYLRTDIIEEVELYCPCGCGYVLEERI